MCGRLNLMTSEVRNPTTEQVKWQTKILREIAPILCADARVEIHKDLNKVQTKILRGIPLFCCVWTLEFNDFRGQQFNNRANGMANENFAMDCPYFVCRLSKLVQ